jgi:hypothetical protein
VQACFIIARVRTPSSLVRERTRKREREREREGGREREKETDREREREMYNMIIEFISLLLTMAAVKGMQVAWHLLVI